MTGQPCARPRRSAQAGALAYELAALVARNSTSVDQAELLIETFAAMMKDQIRRLGVGVEHP